MPRMRCNTSSRSKVESTAWPASYRTAILFMTLDHRNVEEAVGQVPKVTVKKPLLGRLGGFTSTFWRCGSDRRQPRRTRSPRTGPRRTGTADGAAMEGRARERSMPRCRERGRAELESDLPAPRG